MVVYDHQVPTALLQVAPSSAERIDVGPAAPRAFDQEAISILLAEKVAEGKSVVRLKWGDPFVFDSGGKEALLLREQGVPFEIVPGIPAAIGGAAYAGIPLTYPGADDVVIFVRGHEGESEEAPDVNWNGLASVGGTIVCYAGARQIGAISQGARRAWPGGRRTGGAGVQRHHAVPADRHGNPRHDCVRCADRYAGPLRHRASRGVARAPALV